MKTSLGILFLVITLCPGSFINAATETAVDPEAVAAYQAGKAHQKSGNHEDAITEFERAVTVEPDYYAAYFELADLYLEVARPFDAINAYEQLMRLEPGRTEQFQAAINIIEAYSALTLCQTSEPGLDETIAACKKAIGHPELAEDPHTNYLLGVNYIYADDEESAKKQFKDMVLLDIEGAPGMLLHVMMEMKPEWITKKYVEDVNKFTELVVPGLPDELPVEEVRMVEEYYAPEIRYMYELLGEMPDYVFQTDEDYSYYGFDEEWADKKRVEVGAYRFYELMIASPKGSDPLTPKVNRFERSRSYDAEYSQEDIIIKRGLYDEVVEFYAYRIIRNVGGDEFSITAKFEAPDGG
jgi:tetratricopeptide (TPR) repeat protein